MPKTSDWVVVATEGNTVDGRKIAASWIKDMAEQYSKEEYTALIYRNTTAVIGRNTKARTGALLKS